MNKKIYHYIFLWAVVIISNSALLNAQTPLFTIPDTLCAGTEVVPTNIVSGAQNYSWTFCPPQLQYAPQGDVYNTNININTGNAITVVQAGQNEYIGFVANDNGTLTRLTFPNGLSGAPVGTYWGNVDNNVPASPKGIQAVYDGSIWHLFVIGGADLASTSIARFDFANGLQNDPTGSINLGNTNGLLDMPTQFYMAKSGYNWYAFTFNNGSEMVRLDFGADLTSYPNAAVVGSLTGQIHNIGGITGIVENNNWFLFLTDKDSNSLYRLDMGASLNNDTPAFSNLGDFASSLNIPSGISITKNCGEYYGYVLNNGGSGIAEIYWQDSINSTPVNANLFGNVASMVQPNGLSQFTTQDGGLYLFTINNDNTLSKIFYSPCDDASIAASNEMQPQPFIYDTAGFFTVFLTINQGLPNVQTYCENILMLPTPPATYSNDTAICQGDTITIHALSAGTDSFLWSPNYNIDTINGRVIKVWPSHTQVYTSTIYYNPQCYVKHDINVVVHRIAADAGPDRTLGDGSTTIIGGPNTPIGSQYTYHWWPDSFMNSATNGLFATVRPEHSITYYINVNDDFGCTAIDSVNVIVTCDNIHMPTAFSPQSNDPRVATFGLMNLEFVKINYFKVYDRWGKEVFTTDDPHARWDGKLKGKDVPQGVYVWEVDAFCNLTGERYKSSGSVTLLR